MTPCPPLDASIQLFCNACMIAHAHNNSAGIRQLQAWSQDEILKIVSLKATAAFSLHGCLWSSWESHRGVAPRVARGADHSCSGSCQAVGSCAANAGGSTNDQDDLATQTLCRSSYVRIFLTIKVSGRNAPAEPFAGWQNYPSGRRSLAVTV